MVLSRQAAQPGHIRVLLGFISRVMDMKTTLRGRLRLNIELPQIPEAVRRHGQVMAAATELRCSDAYIHVRFKRAGLTLREVLNAADMETLLTTGNWPWGGSP